MSVQPAASPLRQTVVSTFQRVFGAAPPMVVRAPGRVNLIGEHTDYNDGFVLPLAIERAVWIALRPRDDDKVRLHSLDAARMGEPSDTEFSLQDLQHGGPGWSEYVKGMVWALQEDGHGLRGWEGVMAGNVPIGAGLSSSAALEMATARASAAASDLSWDAVRMALLAQRAENRWVGVNCGIMDQLIAGVGRAGHAVLIDCRSLDLQAVPLPPKTRVVVLDTATRRGLVSSAYNERRQQCEAVAKDFGVKALRDVSLPQLQERQAQAEQGKAPLESLAFRRASHVISENDRTVSAVKAMADGDADLLGQLMNESHESLRRDFEVSNEQLDLMVSLARADGACFGARMTGAGFGGCAVALVSTNDADRFAMSVADRYHKETDLKPNVYVCEATDGAGVA